MSSNSLNPSGHAVALYRVSTAEQGQSGLGLEAQQASVRAFIATQGWTLIGEYSDIASGKDVRRPGFQAALARCRQLGAVRPAGPDHPPRPHPVAVAGRRGLHPGSGYAGRGRSDDVDLW